MTDVVPPRIYYRVYGLLLVATVLTWGVSRLHLGSPMGVMVALLERKYPQYTAGSIQSVILLTIVDLAGWSAT